MTRLNKLIRRLRRIVGPKLHAEFLPDPVLLNEQAWDDWYDRIVERSIRLGKEVRRNQRRIRESYSDFEHLPSGRQAVILRSSPPPMLLALVRDLTEASYMYRFKDPRESLRLAELALHASDSITTLPEELRADLRAEILGYLGNAQRINGRLIEAAKSFQAAERCRSAGTGDRHLKADLLDLRSTFEFSKGNAREAAALQDREILLWRLLHQPDRLGQALLDRSVKASWCESAERSREFMLEGLRHTTNPLRVILALSAYAERLARDGEGADAWVAICDRDVLVHNAGMATMDGFEGLLIRFKWVSGLAYRALGKTDRATRWLEEVRAAFLERESPILSAQVSLDLAALHAARGDPGRVKELSEQAFVTFRAEGLEQRALAAFQVLYKAAQAEMATAELAEKVANFVVRSQYDKNLRFTES